MVTGMTFLTWAAIKINRKLLILEISCLSEWIIVVKCLELLLKWEKIKSVVLFFGFFFSPKFLHCCRMTHKHKTSVCFESLFLSVE